MRSAVASLATEGVRPRLSLNVQELLPGHCRKRPGVNKAATIGVDFGGLATPPSRIFRWYYGAQSTLVSFGMLNDVFVNPINSYLYSRTSATAAIWDTVAHTLSATWGLPTPSTALGTDVGTKMSQHSSGAYIYAVVGWDATRRVTSPPLFGTYVGTLSELLLTDQLQWIGGPGWSVAMKTIPTMPTGASHLRYYREMIHTYSGNGQWAPRRASDWGISGMRLFKEVAVGGSGSVAKDTTDYLCIVNNTNKQPSTNPTYWMPLSTLAAAAWANDVAYVANGSFVDQGSQGMGEILTFTHTVTPFGVGFMMFDGRLFTGDGYNVYYSNPGCPETYAGPTTVNGAPISPTLAVDEGGLLTGEARLVVSPWAGTIVAMTSHADRGLVLCQHGAWTLDVARDGATYRVGHDRFTYGCVSRATVDQTPWGSIWLSDSTLVLWNGQSCAPITKGHVDFADPSINAATDLSGAMGAYDWKHGQYLCVIPTAAQGQVILEIQLDQLEHQRVVCHVWALEHTETIVGIGYDPEEGEIVFLFADASCQYVNRASFKDVDATQGTTYPMTLEVDYQGPAGAVVRNPGVTLTASRASPTEVQTATVQARGMPCENVAAGNARGPFTLSWAANDMLAKSAEIGVSGRLIRVTVTQEDAFDFELQELTIGEAADMVLAHSG